MSESMAPIHWADIIEIIARHNKFWELNGQILNRNNPARTEIHSSVVITVKWQLKLLYKLPVAEAYRVHTQYIQAFTVRYIELDNMKTRVSHLTIELANTNAGVQVVSWW